jgi:hypothetical protein
MIDVLGQAVVVYFCVVQTMFSLYDKCFNILYVVVDALDLKLLEGQDRHYSGPCADL